MCVYCGCQSIPSIELLTAGHDAALDDVSAAELATAAGDLEAAEATCAALGEVLEPHTAVEEEAFFPARPSPRPRPERHPVARLTTHPCVDDGQGGLTSRRYGAADG